MRLAEAVRQLKQSFEQRQIEDSQKEAEHLITQSLGISFTDLVLNPEKELKQEEWEKLNSRLLRRLQGEPLAYIMGFSYFYRHCFEVNPHVLIPRADTEILVEEALRLPAASAIADLGSGSGCIGLSLLKEWPESVLTAIDISAEALKVTLANAKNLDVVDRLRVLNKDIGQLNPTEQYDMVVSNPPYIDISDGRIAEDVKKFEPSLALFAANNGLQFYQEWTPWAFQSLRPQGHLLYEVGAGQAQEVQRICLQNGFKNIKIREDFSGIQRLLIAQKDKTYG